MVFNNKEVFHGQKYLNLEEPKGNTFIRFNQYMVQTQLEAAVLGRNKSLVSVFNKDGNINQLTINGNTLLEEVLIFWLGGMYGFINNLINFIEYINFLISQNARLTDELGIEVQQDISKEVSDFVESIDNNKYDMVAYKKEDVIFTSIRNARLKMGKLLEGDFCRNNCLFNSHFNINGNKGYAQKNCNTGMRNYVVYRGCIAMRISWSVVSFDKNSSQIVKKENINIYIKDNGTVHVNEQDESRYKNREINFDGCCVLIGGIPLKDALNKGRWLYSNNQMVCDSGYCETSSEGKTSVFDSNNNNLVNLNTCKNKMNQESNKSLSVKDNPEPDTKEDNCQSIDLEDSSLGYSSDIESNTIDDITYYKFPLVNSVTSEESIKIGQIMDENYAVKKENLSHLKKLNSNKLYAQFSKEKKCTYEQQMTIACGISIDNSQVSLEHGDRNNNITESNLDSSVNEYCENMEQDKEALNIISNSVDSKKKVAIWLNDMQSGHDSTSSPYSNGFCLRKNPASNVTSSPEEPDRSSANGLSWDNNTLDLDDMEIDYNPPHKILFSDNKYRNNSVSSKLDTLCETPNNNPSYNLNESQIFSIVQDPCDNITKFGIYNIRR